MTSSKISSAPCVCRHRAQGFEIARRGRNAASVADDRLDDDRSDFAWMGGEGGLDRSNVVERQREREVRDLLRNARGARNAEGSDAGAGFDQQAIRSGRDSSLRT